jgi:hypothetical protein
VEGRGVATAMVAFGHCLNGDCARPPELLALDLAHACREEVAGDYQINLEQLPKRPSPVVLH